MKNLLKLFLILALLTTSAFAARDEQAVRIERDLSVMVSQLKLLLEKKTDVLLETLDKSERNKFEKDVLTIKNEIENLSRQFATKGRP